MTISNIDKTGYRSAAQAFEAAGSAIDILKHHSDENVTLKVPNISILRRIPLVFHSFIASQTHLLPWQPTLNRKDQEEI